MLASRAKTRLINGYTVSISIVRSHLVAVIVISRPGVSRFHAAFTSSNSSS